MISKSKYIAAALLFLANNEIISLAVLLILLVLLGYDMMKVRLMK